jgi:hypothetical protein
MGIVRTGAGRAPLSKDRRGSLYSSSVILSCSIDLTAARAGPDRSPRVLNRYRRESSSLSTGSPQARHTPTALDENADVNANRGPNSTLHRQPPPLASRSSPAASKHDFSSCSPSRSNVSESSHSSLSASPAVSGRPSGRTLKQLSVSTASILEPSSPYPRSLSPSFTDGSRWWGGSVLR